MLEGSGARTMAPLTPVFDVVNYHCPQFGAILFEGALTAVIAAARHFELH